jgi:hypothetical protein
MNGVTLAGNFPEGAGDGLVITIPFLLIGFYYGCQSKALVNNNIEGDGTIFKSNRY